MSGIGTDELPPPPATVNGPFASNLQVIPVIEGPQILVLWSLPTSPDTTHIKLMRKRLNYSVNDTDGTELVNSTIGLAPNSYVDLNPDEQRAWCYTAFVRHDCSVLWTADTFVAADQTVIPRGWTQVAPRLVDELNIFALAAFNGKIYGGTYPNAKLYEWNGVDAWVEVANTPGAETDIYSLAVFNNKLYGGTYPNGKLYEWNGSTAWVQVADKLVAEEAILSLAVFNNKLYGGTYPNGKLYEWDGATTWVKVADPLGSETDILSLAVYNGKLYGGTYPGGMLYEWDGATTWVKVADTLGGETQISALAVYNGELYGGTAGDAKLYKWNGVDAWVQVATQFGTETNVASLIVHNGKLYGGTSPSGKLVRWNDVNAWVEVAPQRNSEIGILSLAVLGNKIYGGTAQNGNLFEWESAATDFFYVSRSRGITGATEPVWPTEIGDTVTDGDIVWECLSVNPGWVATKKSRGAGFTWDSEYMQRLMFGTVPRVYRNEDAKSTQTKLDAQTDSDYFDAWRAVHEDGLTSRGEFERFLLIFGAALSRMKGAIDFYPRLIDPDECLPQYLPQLAGILGWELSTKSSTAQQRQELLSAVPVYKVKGTSGSMEPLARSAATVANVIVDPMSSHILMSNRINRLSARGVDGLAYTSWALTTVTARGDIVIPTSANRTGYYYQAIQAGTTAASEPTWPTTPGDDVTDGTVTWRTREFSAPHLTADASIGATSITVASTAEFEVGKTVNIRDDVTTGGEERVIADIPDSVTLEFSPGLANAYTLANDAKVTPAFDWHDDETGFIWDRPTVDEFDGIDPARVRVSGAILDPSALYSFEFLRIWFILAIGEAVSSAELERLDRLMEQFAPADTTYVVRIEQE